MNRFDELFTKAKDLASAAGIKAQEVAEVTKLKLQASQLRNEIDDNYLKLGETIYELNKNGTENEALVNMCIAEIEEQLKELEELNDKIDSMKQVIRCPSCGLENPQESLYCSRCGTSLRDPVPEDVEQPAEEVTEDKAPD